MKRIFIVFLAGLLVTGFSCLVFAQEKNDDMTDMPMAKHEMAKDEKMEGKGMMMRQGMMMGMCGMMMSKSMVSSSDGGVIVLAGDKLQKYDKDLALVKEVQVKMDMEGMQKKMKGACSMMKEEEKE